MKKLLTMLAAAAVLLEVMSGCAQLGIPTPAGMSTPDTPVYHQNGDG